MWGWLTHPYRLNAWIGQCKGQPQAGAVRILAAGIPGAEWEHVAVLGCDPPHRFLAEVSGHGHFRHIELRLSYASPYTTVTFRLRVSPYLDESEVGVWAEYMLDRLVASHGKHPMPVWEDYQRVLLPYYRHLLTQPPISVPATAG